MPHNNDPRNIENGRLIPGEAGYADQPYVTIAKDGRWVCVMTTGQNPEGKEGQHVVSTWSKDSGRSWSPLVDIEPASGPNSSWAVSVTAPSGRLFVMYLYNGDEAQVIPGATSRLDTVGWLCLRYSDDNGESWSRERIRIPLRETATDRNNVYGGKHQMFWGVQQPFVVEDRVYVALTKMRKQLREEDGWVVVSEDLFEKDDPAEAAWDLLPLGDAGIHAEELGFVQEEHQFAPMQDGGMYCVFRTTTGYLAECYSEDGGRTWSHPQLAAYYPGGPYIKTPCACPALWKTFDGHFLLWFHNHSGKTVHEDRSVVWLTAGVERHGRIHWAQPEILLYWLGGSKGMSYPSLIEQGGRYWVTETEKSKARVHNIDENLLDALYEQGQGAETVQEGMVLSVDEKAAAKGTAKLPGTQDLSTGGAFTLELWVDIDDLRPGQVVLDSRNGGGPGMTVAVAPRSALSLTLSDGSTTVEYTTDEARLTVDRPRHFVFIVDGASRVLSAVVNADLCKGDYYRQFGWLRLPPELGAIPGGEAKLAPDLKGRLLHLRMYDRYLLTSEAIGNCLASAYSSGNEYSGIA